MKEIQQEYKDRDKNLELNQFTGQLCSGRPGGYQGRSNVGEISILGRLWL